MIRLSGSQDCSIQDQRETVILVDTEDKVIGSSGKLPAHRTGKLHRAFSILITNPQGELLLQQRAAQKYHFAGRWSNTCCGHPRPGEKTWAAAERRLHEELGFTVPLTKIANIKLERTRSCHNAHCVLRTSGIVIIMFLVSLIEVVAWAVPFLLFGAIDGLEKAVYFSMVTYTTLGYGDVLLDEQWRLLASFEAANGIIMFGWTTAIVMYAIKNVFFSDKVVGETS